MPFFNCTDCIKIYYEVKGRCDSLPLVMVPGMGGDILTFSSIAFKLSKIFPVILTENIGVGKSSVPKPPYSVKAMAEHLGRLLTYLGIEKFNLIGHSMGGYIAQELAAEIPGAVNKLLLSGTAQRMREEVYRCFYDIYLDLKEHRVDRRSYFSKILKYLTSSDFFENIGLREAVLDFMEMAPHPQTINGFKGQLSACKTFNSNQLLDKIEAETLVFTGKDDIVTNVVESELLHECIPNSNLSILQGVGHLPFLENPELYFDTIINFIR